MNPIQAPTLVSDTLERPWVFLAGAIDQDRAERWQDQVIRAFADLPGTVLNPRQDAWDASWGQDLDDPRFAGQVAWELDALDRADLVLCWLPAGSQAPISLLEVGLHARGGRLVVGCPIGFHRRGNVRAVCARYQCPCWPSLAEAMTDIQTRVTGLLTHHQRH